MGRGLAAVIVLPLLLGCATAPELPASVSVPVAVACVGPDTPPVPQVTPAAELAKLGDYELVLRIAAERLELASWASVITPVLSACR